MHSVFFGGKRAHLSTTKFCREVLVRVGLTPNRYDLLLYLNHKRETLTQRDLRKAFGVSRATMSEALRSLVQLGLVERSRSLRDTRTFAVKLTDRGRRVFENARCIAKSVVRRILAELFPYGDRLLEMHDAIDRHLLVREVFGDTAVRELVWLWHPDD